MTTSKGHCKEPVLKILISENGEVVGMEDARTGKTVPVEKLPRLAEKPLDLHGLHGMLSVDILLGKLRGQTAILLHIPPCYFLPFVPGEGFIGG